MESEVPKMDEIAQGKKTQNEKIGLRREPWQTLNFKRLGKEEEPEKDTQEGTTREGFKLETLA